jgi:hypothetical protein
MNSVITEAAVSDGVLVDVGGYCLDELLTELLAEADEASLTGALSRVLAPERNCANSFQSSI